MKALSLTLILHFAFSSLSLAQRLYTRNTSISHWAYTPDKCWATIKGGNALIYGGACTVGGGLILGYCSSKYAGSQYTPSLAYLGFYGLLTGIPSLVVGGAMFGIGKLHDNYHRPNYYSLVAKSNGIGIAYNF